MANWNWCIGTLQRIVSDLAIYDDLRMIEVDVADAYQVQPELVYRELVTLCVEINVPQGTGTIHLVLAAIDGSQPTHHEPMGSTFLWASLTRYCCTLIPRERR